MTSLLKTLKQDWSLSATVVGFLAVLISYSGPLIIFFQAAQKAQVSSEMMISWIWGISIGAALTGIYLSIRFKTPIITAWSAPGTALLVSLFPNISLNEAVSAFTPPLEAEYGIRLIPRVAIEETLTIVPF